LKVLNYPDKNNHFHLEIMMNHVKFISLLFLLVSFSYASDLSDVWNLRNFRPENFEGYEKGECKNFFDALTFMGEIEVGDINSKKRYYTKNNCVIYKYYSGRYLDNIIKICPDKIISKVMRFDSKYLSSEYPTLILKKEEFPSSDWGKFLPCRMYRDYKRPKL